MNDFCACIEQEIASSSERSATTNRHDVYFWGDIAIIKSGVLSELQHIADSVEILGENYDATTGILGGAREVMMGSVVAASERRE